jgi:hypothetical protein
VWYKETELYGGLFTINKEHPEYVGQYWEDTIRGLWNLNSVSQNTEFLSQFPTDDSLIEYLNNGGGPVENLWIPVIYPDAARQFWYNATMVPVAETVDLSQIVVSIYKPTKEEIFSYSPSYATGTKYISFAGGDAEVLIEKFQIEGRYLLKLTFRQDLLTDAETENDRGIYICHALSETKTSEENLLAANQLLNGWMFELNISSTFYANGGMVDAWITKYSPSVLQFGVHAPTPKQLTDFATVDSSPISIR